MKKDLPEKFILTKRPKQYLKQGINRCGLYSVKGILEAYELDDKDHPKDYPTDWLGKMTGFAVGKNYYTNILNNYGLKSAQESAENLNKEEKLYLLKSLLVKNSPVMMRIGNGYLGKKFNPLWQKIVTHWITIWGYDDEKEILFDFDSALTIDQWGTNLSIGNTVRTYKDMLSDWNFGRLQPWSWSIDSANYLYISIK